MIGNTNIIINLFNSFNIHSESLFYGSITAILSWFILNMVGKPILEIQDKRLKAIRIAERYAYVGFDAPMERATAVRYELNDIASHLRANARGQFCIRFYCWFLKYNLEMAAGAIGGLASMIGDSYSNETRKNNLNLVYIALNAHNHLPKDEVLKIKNMWEETKQN